jgi:hypothetical protein
MRMVNLQRVRVGAPARAALLACGGTGLAGIGQLADIAIGQGPATTRRSAHSLDRSRGRRTGPTGQASLPLRERPELCGHGGGRLRPALAAGPFPLPGSLPPVPDRLGGELGAGSDVKLGEHVREMSLHRPA